MPEYTFGQAWNLAARTAKRAASFGNEWEKFLCTAARIHQASFFNQLLVYAQMPEASLCSTRKNWDQYAGRAVSNGEKGITVFAAAKRQVEEVYELSQTESTENSRPMPAWKPDSEDIREIIEEAPGGEKQFLPALYRMVEGETEKITDVSAEERRLIRNSAFYALAVKCGMEPDMKGDAFLGIEQYRYSPNRLSRIGVPVNRLVRQFYYRFRVMQANREEIGIEEKQEQAYYNGERKTMPDIPAKTEEPGREEETDGKAGQHRASGEYPVLEPGIRNVGPGGAVRQDAVSLPEGISGGGVQADVPGGDPWGASEGNRGTGRGNAGEPGEGDGQKGPAAGQSVGQPGMDSPYERTDRPGQGDRPARPDLLLNEEKEPKAEESPSAFLVGKITDGEVSAALEHILSRDMATISGYFAQHEERKDRAEYLKRLLGIGGRSDALPGMWEDHNGKGIRFTKGSLLNPDAVRQISWSEAAGYVGKLLDAGRELEEPEVPMEPKTDTDGQLSVFDFLGKATEIEKKIEDQRSAPGTFVFLEQNTVFRVENTAGEEVTLSGLDGRLRTLPLPSYMELIKQSPLNAHLDPDGDKTKIDVRCLYKECLYDVLAVFRETETHMGIQSGQIDEDTAWDEVENAVGRIMEANKDTASLMYEAYKEWPLFSDGLYRDTYLYSLRQKENPIPDDFPQDYSEQMAGSPLEPQWIAGQMLDAWEGQVIAPPPGREQPQEIPKETSETETPAAETPETSREAAGSIREPDKETLSPFRTADPKEGQPEDTKPTYDPSAPPYKVGTLVYIDKKEYRIRSLKGGIVRLEPERILGIGQFESWLRADSRNGAISEYLFADPKKLDEDLREILTGEGGLLTERDKAYLSEWMRNREGNTRIGQRLAQLHAGETGTVTLTTGETADYYVTTTYLETNVHGDKTSKEIVDWNMAARTLRTLYRQELDGLSHEPAERKNQAPHEGTPPYKVGDHVTLPAPDHPINGTIGYIGDTDVRIDTGPYSWSNEVVNKEVFERLLRQETRNDDSFEAEIQGREDEQPTQPETSGSTGSQAASPVPDLPGQTMEEQTEAKAPATVREIYEKYLPIVREKVLSDQPYRNAVIHSDRENAIREGGEAIKRAVLSIEDTTFLRLYYELSSFHNKLHQAVLEETYTALKEPPAPDLSGQSAIREGRNAQNYRITDDHLGEGGPKLKYQANITAIRLLKELEAAGRQASQEQQEILSRYVGWGGLPDVFDESKAAWAKEYRELRELLTPDEYQAARGSTLNAHYTSPIVIRAIYGTLGRMGFSSGRILEPACGVGNFFGMLPEGMSASHLYGVELDSISGRIARQLYPDADITVAGFETTDRRDFFDLAVGNVPFGQYQAHDKAYNKLGFSIHNYFFAKSLDQVRPGGIVAFLTSRYTMDGKDPKVREYLAQRADFLGAVRLPDDAFKSNAGTRVVSDIVFLQKREHMQETKPEWTQVGQTAEGFTINQYFLSNPEMVLGTLTAVSTQYGRQDFTIAPLEGQPLETLLNEALLHIDGTYLAREPDNGEIRGPEEEDLDTLTADASARPYSFVERHGDVYFHDGTALKRCTKPESTKKRIRSLLRLRDLARGLISAQLNGADDEEVRRLQRELDVAYDQCFADYGRINDTANRRAFSDDDGYSLLCSLEVLDDDGQFLRKADIFFRRTIAMPQPIMHADTPRDALAVSIGERAKVDVPFMAQLCGKTEEEVTEALAGEIFQNPETGQWEAADEYLSGNIRKKLAAARAAAGKDARYAPNVDALTGALPKDLDATEIDARLGAPWIAPEYIDQFMQEVFKIPSYFFDDRHGMKTVYTGATGEWTIAGARAPAGNVLVYNTYGTKERSAVTLLEDCLNLRWATIYTTIVIDGKERRVPDTAATTVVQQKQEAIRDAFKEWVFQDLDRREALCREYNDRYNAISPRKFDGSFLRISGMNPEIRLKKHQLDAIARILYGGNTLLAHVVGAGKTFEMVAAAMESKRLGLCQKSLFVVPNHLTMQWGSEFIRLYPGANVLVATKKDFEKENRKKFCARIATGDYDAVIIGHSQFEKIPLSPERQERILEEQLDELTAQIQEANRGYLTNERAVTVKQLERQKKVLEARLENLHDLPHDYTVTFEELGVDRLFVDESHHYKNLYFTTKMSRVAGLAQSDAKKSSDMYAKCRYMDELTGGKVIVFATGTPVTNSMAELYTNMRYLQHGRLAEMGMLHFDGWAATFGEPVTALEVSPTGKGFQSKTRFSRFFNLPELMAVFHEVADVQTADMLRLPVPEAEYVNEVCQASEEQKAIVESLAERAEKIKNRRADSSDNMLLITNDGRKCALDQRLLNPLLPDAPGSKVNRCVENIYRIWRDTEGERSAQLVFCDRVAIRCYK